MRRGCRLIISVILSSILFIGLINHSQNVLPVVHSVANNFTDLPLIINMQHIPYFVDTSSTTKIIKVIHSNNETQMKEEMLNAISSSPTPELRNTVKDIIENGTKDRQCTFNQIINVHTTLKIDCVNDNNPATTTWNMFNNTKDKYVIPLKSIILHNIGNHTFIIPGISASH